MTAHNIRKPDDSVTVRAMAAISVATALSLLGDSSLYTILPINTAEAGVTVAALAILLSANRWVRLLTNNVAGWLADRWARRPVFLLAMAIGTISTLMYGLTSGYVPLLVARILWGTAWSGIWVVGNAIVLDISDDSNRGRLLGIYNVAFSIGAATGSGLGGVLNDWLGYRTTVTIEGIVTLLGFLFAVIVLPETSGYRKPSSASFRPDDPAEQQTTRPLANLSRFALLSTLVAFVMYGANRIVNAGMFFPTFSLFIETTLGESINIIGRTVGAASIAGVSQSFSILLGLLIIPAAGALSDRVANRWQVGAATVVPAIVGLWLLPIGTLSVILLSVPLISITAGSIRSVTTAILGDVTPEAARGKTMGLLFSVGDLCSAVGPLARILAAGYQHARDAVSHRWFNIPGNLDPITFSCI